MRIGMSDGKVAARVDEDFNRSTSRIGAFVTTQRQATGDQLDGLVGVSLEKTVGGQKSCVRLRDIICWELQRPKGS